MGLPLSNIAVGTYRDSQSGRNIEVFRVNPLHVGPQTRGTVEYYYHDDPNNAIVTQYNEFAEGHRFIPYAPLTPGQVVEPQTPAGSESKPTPQSPAGLQTDSESKPTEQEDSSESESEVITTQLSDPESVADAKSAASNVQNGGKRRR